MLTQPRHPVQNLPVTNAGVAPEVSIVIPCLNEAETIETVIREAQAALEGAKARLRERVAAILTPDQKALIEKINAAYAAANEETGIIYADKFASPYVKEDPEARGRLQQEKNQDTEEGFLHKLDGILNPTQREAMTRAAENEAQRNAPAGTKKPVKQ